MIEIEDEDQPMIVGAPEFKGSVPCFPTGHALLVGMPLVEVFYSRELGRWCYDLCPVAPDEIHIPFGVFSLNT